jgi:acetyl-CoA acetyltransferase
MEDVYIIGVGMIRFGKYLNGTVKGMAKDAVGLVLEDAGLKKDDIEAAYVANTFWGMFNGQHSIRGQVILRSIGMQGLPITNVENACAGASTALNLACHGVACGAYDVALALGVEKITNENKALSFQAYATCLDVEGFNEHIEFLLNVGKSLNLDTPEESGAPGEGRSIFMDIYSIGARWHMATYGSTQRQLAEISAKNHFHSSLNPLSQYQKSMTTEEVLNDRPISYPLTRAMCAPVGDGAAAAIVCSKEYLKGLTGARPVRVRASVLGSGTDRPIDGVDIGERLSKKAYEVSGIGPGDIGVAEVHDATAYGELHQTEAMGFCPEGEGGILAESGATRLGGRLPINTSGGLESRGHPIGASGLAQIHEIVTQLRGEAGKRQAEGVKIGLAENGGGNIGVEEAAMCVHILEKV